jgi:hypothetical protein
MVCLGLFSFCLSFFLCRHFITPIKACRGESKTTKTRKWIGKRWNMPETRILFIYSNVTRTTTIYYSSFLSVVYTRHHLLLFSSKSNQVCVGNSKEQLLWGLFFRMPSIRPLLGRQVATDGCQKEPASQQMNPQTSRPFLPRKFHAQTAIDIRIVFGPL